VAKPLFGDIDGDGRDELLIASGDKREDGRFEWLGAVIDHSMETDSLTLHRGAAHDEVRTLDQPPELLRSMSPPGLIVSGPIAHLTYAHWRFDGQSLARLET
jgi:hypothetical protein